MKLLKSLIATGICCVMLFNSTVFALESDIQEAIDNENKKPKDTFIYPKKVNAQNNEVLNQPSDLRLPETVQYIDEDEAQFGKPISVSQHTKVYKTGEYTYKTVLTEIPNTFEDAMGNQREFDNTLVKETEDNYITKANDMAIRISTQNQRLNCISLYNEGVGVAITPLEGDYSNSTINNNAVLYNDVFDGVDVQSTAHELGVKQDIIINNLIERSSFEYELDSYYEWGSQEVAFSSENGVINLHKHRQYNPVMTITAPKMIDAAGKISDKVTLSLKQVLGKSVATVVADSEWISSPERVFPIKISNNIKRSSNKIAISTISELRGTSEENENSYTGYVTNEDIGSNDANDMGQTRTLLRINDKFDFISQNVNIEKAYLEMFEKTDLSQDEALLECSRIKTITGVNDWMNPLTWDEVVRADCIPSGQDNISKSQFGVHKFDIKDSVDYWISSGESVGELIIKNMDEQYKYGGGVFYTPICSEILAGRQDCTRDKAPKVVIEWRYTDNLIEQLNNTTVNLKPIVENKPDGTTNFKGIFAAGTAKIDANVQYSLNSAANVEVQGNCIADKYQIYPDTANWSDFFNSNTNTFNNKDSNWQTQEIFSKSKYNTEYYYSATPSIYGETGATIKSDKFIIYQVKQLDRLFDIANYYGVSINTIKQDNYLKGETLVPGSTLFIRNPNNNASKPYTLASLSNQEKDIAKALLLGKGLHCDFGMKTVNLNTGNFYLNQNDIKVPDYTDFGIKRAYNSFSSEYNSIFGRGWQFNYSEKLSKLEDSSIMYTRSDGSGIQFKKSNAGYITPDGYYYSLKEVGNGYEIADVDKTTRYFNNAGLLTQIKDYKGRATRLNYDENCKLISVISPSDIAFYLLYTPDGKVKSITLPDEKCLKYEYDENDNLICFKDGLNNKTTYTYDDKHQMLSWTYGEGNAVSTNVYDASARVIKQTDANGLSSMIFYHHQIDNELYDEQILVLHERLIRDIQYSIYSSVGKIGNLSLLRDSATNPADRIHYENLISSEEQTLSRYQSQLDALKNWNPSECPRPLKTVLSEGVNITNYYFDSDKRTVKIEYPNQCTEQIEYANNKMSSFINKMGHKNSYIYDSQGNIIKETRFDGAISTGEYNDFNQITKFIDFDGKQTTYEYDTNGNLIKKVNNDKSFETYEYDSENKQVSKTDANGNETKYEHNKALISAIIDAKGNKTQYYYNPCGQLVSMVNPSGKITRYVYDNAGNKVMEQFSDDSLTKYTYNSMGLLTSVTDAKGLRSTIEYDNAGNMISIIDPTGLKVTYAYDAKGNRISETDPAGKVTSYEYNDLSKLIKITDADGKVTIYEYDKLGNHIKTIDPNGNVSEITYEPTFNLPKTHVVDNKVISKYEYNNSGNLVKETTADGNSNTYTYDAMNRVISLTEPNGIVTQYEYDNNGNVIKVSDSLGKVLSYAYDSKNRQIAVTKPNGGVFKSSYDALGRLETSTDALGHVTTYSYDIIGRLVAKTDPLKQITKYEYDKNGNLTKQTAPNGAVTLAEYNAVNQISLVTDPLNNQTSMVYDKSGNLSSMQNALGYQWKYEYNGKNLPTKITDTLGNIYDMIYDNNGNNTEIIAPDKSKVVNEYDSLNRLVKTTDAAGLVTTYKYDDMNRATEVKDNAGNIVVNTYDKVGNLVQTKNALDQVTTYTYDLNGNVTSQTTFDGNKTTYKYDFMGNVISIIDPEGKETSYSYDANGKLLTKEDSQHRKWQYTYDEIGRLTKTTNPLSQSTQYQYNPLNKITKQIDAKGNATISEFDVMGNQTSVTDQNGNKTSFVYDELNRVISTISPDGGKQNILYDKLDRIVKNQDPLGNVTNYEYDIMGNLKKLKYPNGGTYQYEYNKHGVQTGVIDPLGNKTISEVDLNQRLLKKKMPNGAEYSYQYDAIGRITSIHSPEGMFKNLSYDEKGNLLSETDQANRKISYTYDKMHRLLDTINPNGQKTSFTYDSAGNLSNVVTPKGYKTSYSYDVLDRKIKELDPVGRTTEYTYDVLGNVEKITKNGGRVTNYTYDNVGNVTSVTNPLNQTKTMSYDNMNRLVLETDPLGRKTACTYDLNGHVTSITDKRGAVTKFTYDEMGNVKTKSDPENRKTTFGYDLLNRLTSVIDGDNIETKYGYDTVGNMTSRTDGEGGKTTFAYDLANRVTSITNPLDETKNMAYNIQGKLSVFTNPDGTKINYEYDKLDALVSKSSASDTTIQAMYGYDEEGRKISMSDVAGTTEYSYDEVGRITAVTTSNGAKILYTYDSYGNLSKLTYPDSTYVTYEYDELDRLTQITDRKGLVTKYRYDCSGNLIEVSRPNKTITKLSYDEAGNVIKLENLKEGSLISSFEYSYDLSGFITNETATQGKSKVIKTYTYDSRGQLSNVTETSGDSKIVYDFSYDKNGNRTKQIKHTSINDFVLTNYQFDKANKLTYSEEKLTSGAIANEKRYEYDKNGNLVLESTKNGSTKQYQYNTENRLKTVKEGGNLLLAALYDGNGDRIFTLKPKDETGSSESQHSSYKVNYNNRLIDETILIPNGIDPIQAEKFELTGYINNVNTQYTQVLMEYGRGGNVGNVYDYGINRNSMTNGTDTNYYYYDGRGSVTDVVDINGQISMSYSYNPFGEATKLVDGHINNPYQYNGEYTDSSTGMQYLRARYYSPADGRFISQDTIFGDMQVPLSQNLYAYCKNNPIMFQDPSGNDSSQIEGIKRAITGLEVEIGMLKPQLSTGCREQREAVQQRINEKEKSLSGLKLSLRRLQNQQTADEYKKELEEKAESDRKAEEQRKQQAEADRQSAIEKEALKKQAEDNAKAEAEAEERRQATEAQLRHQREAYAANQNSSHSKVQDAKQQSQALKKGNWFTNAWDKTSNWFSENKEKILKTATIVAGAILVTAAVVLTAGAAAGVIGAMAGAAAFTLGASAGAVSLAVTVGTAATFVGAGAFVTTKLATSASNVGEVWTGNNFIRNDVLGGNSSDPATAQKAQNTYNTVETVANVGTMLFADFGIQCKQAESTRPQTSASRRETVEGGGKTVSSKSIVIGEGMQDIKNVAKQLQAEGVDAKWYQAWSKNFPSNRPMTTDELNAALARNQRWIDSKIKQGYDIYDIGKDPLRTTRSPFYELEQSRINKYVYPTIDFTGRRP